MDGDTLFTFGTFLATLGTISERNGICATRELVETIGSVAVMTMNSGEEYEGRMKYIGS